MNDSRAPKVIDLVYFNAGGGHRAVFEIPRILESIMESGRPCTHRAPASDDAHGAAVLS
jgi:hypothetical protein